HAQSLLRLQARRVIVFRHEDRKEECPKASFFRAHQVELPVRFSHTGIAAVIELTVDGVNVAVEDQRALVEFAGAIGNSLCRERGGRHPTVKLSPTIADALTMGGDKLAVDGVVLVGEHGNYPRNEKGQTKYPRYEFFEQITGVFRSSGKAVPVFSDKHLSW